ncbi:MAG TPA: SDR family oxidoreductase [Terracidiphilus sp.]|nr:SDR family oxidoreductase [Terracidiphilus sp.]
MPRQTLNSQPKEAGPKPPFPQEKQPPPGKEKHLAPKANHGEESYVGNGQLRGKVAIITGADSGIGRAVAIAFAREGADLVLSFLPEEEEDARETERWVKEAGRKAALVAGDIGKKRYCERLVQMATSKFGRLDIVVSNAALQRTYDDIADVPEEEFERTFRTNVFGTFFLSQAAAAVMPEGGSILITCSIQAFEPSPSLLAYAPTKAALVNMTKGMAKALAKKQIRVNGVAPGPVWTPLIPSTMPKEKVKEFGKNTAFERPAQPAELAPVYVFLASQNATYVTAEIYGVTGGRTPY